MPYEQAALRCGVVLCTGSASQHASLLERLKQPSRAVNLRALLQACLRLPQILSQSKPHCNQAEAKAKQGSKSVGLLAL